MYLCLIAWHWPWWQWTYQGCYSCCHWRDLITIHSWACYDVLMKVTGICFCGVVVCQQVSSKWRCHVLTCHEKHKSIFSSWCWLALDNTSVVFLPAFLFCFHLGATAFSSRSPSACLITWLARFRAAAGVATSDTLSFSILPTGTSA